MSNKMCSFCGIRPVVAKGLCNTCYIRQRRNGTLLYYRDRKKTKYEADIVPKLKARFPKFSKVTLCMIRNPKYGVDLSADAKKFLKEMDAK